MTSKLPPDLLNLFTPRPPLTFVKPLDTEPDKKKGPQLTPLSSYLQILAESASSKHPTTETPAQRKERIEKDRKEKAKLKIEADVLVWKPHENSKATQDPYKTLIVSRLNYQISEKDLLREFERYGSINNIKMVSDLSGKPRGYAFIEYKQERDLRYAYHEADGIRILGKRVVVDVERGRTVKGWRPRRLGGGLGGTRIGSAKVNHTYSGRFDPSRLGSSQTERDDGPQPSSGIQRRDSERYIKRDRDNYDDGGYKNSRSPVPLNVRNHRE
ncbi:hypothetical protein BB561_003023 [Smittium simulii]|uniref:U1 small nuclear ribonucleoprotein 70 kDa n=1 Tax=Smittium simulii TaxID=133385 RepID=A0A2T9YN90_9FUNG|nr:hypothetical protein BB561_003023 [Smittium simulii]